MICGHQGRCFKPKHDIFLAGKCHENPAETQSWRHNRDWKSPDVSSEISNFVASDAAGKWPDVYLKTSSDLTLTNVESQSQSVVSGRAVTSPSFTRLPDVELSWYVNMSVAVTELCWLFIVDIWCCYKWNCLTHWQNNLTPRINVKKIYKWCAGPIKTQLQVFQSDVITGGFYWTCWCLKVKSGAVVLVNRHTGISLILLDNTNTGGCRGLALISLVLSQHAEFVGLAEGF